MKRTRVVQLLLACRIHCMKAQRGGVGTLPQTCDDLCRESGEVLLDTDDQKELCAQALKCAQKCDELAEECETLKDPKLEGLQRAIQRVTAGCRELAEMLKGGRA